MNTNKKVATEVSAILEQLSYLKARAELLLVDAEKCEELAESPNTAGEAINESLAGFNDAMGHLQNAHDTIVEYSEFLNLSRRVK